MTTRNYSNTAVQTTLSLGIVAATTTIVVAATTGFPAVPFILALDADQSNQELVLVTNVAGTTLTVTRGYDNTTAVDHSIGAVVRHSHAAIEFKEANDHVNATSAVHGLAGAIAGVSDTQTLTNKTVALGSNTVSGTKAQFDTACTDADFASLAGTETLTNKTLTSPRINGSLMGTDALQWLSHIETASAVNYLQIVTQVTGSAPSLGSNGTDANVSLDLTTKGTGTVKANGVDVVTTTGTQTLTNKTLSTGTKVGAATTDISAAWTAFTPALTNITLGNGTLTGTYVQIGKTVHFAVTFTLGSTSSVAAGARIGTPVTPKDTTNGFPIATATLSDSDTGNKRVYNAAWNTASAALVVVDVNFTSISSTAPWTWATGDSILINGAYEAA